MNGFLYETHLHTCQGSACAVSEGRDYPARYKDLGYSGIFVTDHFFQGNCAAPRTGKWEQRVDAYMRGYFDALEAGEKCGLKVFFGLEQYYNGDEYLVYGIDRQFLLENMYIEAWTRDKLIHEVHAYGGCVVQAHPFRERGYIRKMHFHTEGLDGIEAVNMGNHPHEDASGLRYAENLKLPAVCGSDIHNSRDVDMEKLAAVCLSEELVTGADYGAYLRSGKKVGLVFPADRLDGVAPRMPETPYEITGGRELSALIV